MPCDMHCHVVYDMHCQVADMAREVNGDDDGVWAIRADALERLGRKKEVTLTLGLTLTLTPTLTPNQP